MKIYGGKNKIVLESERGDNQYVVFETINKYRGYTNYKQFTLQEIEDVNEEGVKFLRYKATIMTR